jgi:hypothetical protein
MEEFKPYEDLADQFQRFERAAAKGCEEAIWIWSVVKDVDMEKTALKAAFAKTEKPLGLCLAGKCLAGGDFWFSIERFHFFKKSAEGGCSWGQVEYARCFEYGNTFVARDTDVCLEWLEKAANQNNPMAMDRLGDWFLTRERERAAYYFLGGAELGWKNSMIWVSQLLKDGTGCKQDLRQAVVWSTKGNLYSYVYWKILEEAKAEVETGRGGNFDCSLNQLCFTLGWAMYWYKYGSMDRKDDFANRCMNYYCSCIESQQKSIFTFLLFWNRSTGVKQVGKIMGQWVWKEREDNLVKSFGQSERQEPEMKRIKK